MSCGRRGKNRKKKQNREQALPKQVHLFPHSHTSVLQITAQPCNRCPAESSSTAKQTSVQARRLRECCSRSVVHRGRCCSATRDFTHSHHHNLISQASPDFSCQTTTAAHLLQQQRARKPELFLEQSHFLPEI